jgi:transcriptional regulator with XRE-family HTH domain
MTIGERIKNRREELGITQDELARKCGYKSRSSINKIELSRDLPLKKVSLMADALQTTPADLMGWSDEIPIDSSYPESAQLERALDFYNKYKDAPPQIKAAIDALLKPE